MKKLMSFVFLFSCWSCSGPDDPPVNRWEQDTNTRHINPRDEKFQYAVRRTQAELPRFRRMFANAAGGMDFLVKTSFADQGRVEHMWVDVLKIGADTIIGTLDNDPVRVTHVKSGDTVRIALKNIEDFVVYRGDSVVHGDFFNRALEQ